jgi:Tic22-like family
MIHPLPPSPVSPSAQLYKQAGLDVPGFLGVPVFQAEGLTVRTTEARYTPLFFSKDDLDKAIGNAAAQRDTQVEDATQAKLDRARQELSEAQKEVLPPS